MSSAARTRVYLTVDVECAEERVLGATVQPPLDYDLRVWGRLRNQREELGVPLLVKELGRAGVAATFFVEAFGARYFGEGELRELCRRLLEAGQDVQLHLHPVQRRPDWHSRGEPRSPDDVAAFELEEQTALLREGLGVLERAGVPAGGLRAFRAGNYGASNVTWRAMRAAGLSLSSSLNLSYLGKNCRIRWPREPNALFATDVEGVWELPISNFSEGRGRYRHVEICAASFAEMRHYLLEARRLGIPEVTIVTHSFEFFFVDSIAGKRGRPNPVSIERLRSLLDFLRDRSADFEVDTAGALAHRLAGASAGAVPPAGEREVPAGRPLLRWERYLSQARQRLHRRSPFAQLGARS